jgi:hypothetical protein
VPNIGAWTQVVLDMHPDHSRGAPGGLEEPNLPHPTGEPQYNYFDTLTRFYLESLDAPSTYPATYLMGDIKFYQHPNPENDDQVRNITATYSAPTNRPIITWNRNKDENTINHEVRYSFSDIHQIGWNAATPAPNGVITPPGWQGYNGMVYDTTALPLTGHTMVYIAIKPQNSTLFSEVAVPLNLD